MLVSFGGCVVDVEGEGEGSGDVMFWFWVWLEMGAEESLAFQAEHAPVQCGVDPSSAVPTARSSSSTKRPGRFRGFDDAETGSRGGECGMGAWIGNEVSASESESSEESELESLELWESSSRSTTRLR